MLLESSGYKKAVNNTPNPMIGTIIDHEDFPL